MTFYSARLLFVVFYSLFLHFSCFNFYFI